MEEKETGKSERILLSALRLMKDKGFKSITIKDIAKEAEVSEMTVFRHFESKKGVLEAAVEKYSFVPSFKNLFADKLTMDLEKDLHLIATLYFDLMENNQSIFLIAIQERATMPELITTISKNTKQLKDCIMEYFMMMQENGKMVEGNVNFQTTTFMSMLFGYFSSNALWGDLFIKENKEKFIINSVQTFCNGIKK